MKKIFALLLAFACLFAVVSCNDDNTGDNGDTGNGGDKTATETYQEIVAATNPSKISVTTKVVTEGFGELEGSYVATFDKTKNTAVVEYSYEVWNEITADSTVIEEKTTKSGTVNRAADGTYSGDLDGKAEAIAAGVAIDVSKISGFP